MIKGGPMTAPQILPMSDMRNRHAEVMEKLTNGPVFLTRHGAGEAVLLSMKQWEKLMAHLEEKDDIIDVLEAELEAARNGEQAELFTADELTALAAEHEVSA
jgi:prevent-host-death family protein